MRRGHHDALGDAGRAGGVQDVSGARGLGAVSEVAVRVPGEVRLADQDGGHGHVGQAGRSSPVVTRAAGRASVIMRWMRSAGKFVSSGRYAAPTFCTASSVTSRSAVRGRATATKRSGAAPRSARSRATALARRFSSPYERATSPAVRAVAPGCRAACRSKLSRNQRSSAVRAVSDGPVSAAVCSPSRRTSTAPMRCPGSATSRASTAVKRSARRWAVRWSKRSAAYSRMPLSAVRGAVVRVPLAQVEGEVELGGSAAHSAARGHLDLAEPGPVRARTGGSAGVVEGQQGLEQRGTGQRTGRVEHLDEALEGQVLM